MAEVRAITITIKSEEAATQNKDVEEKATGSEEISSSTKKSGGVSSLTSILVNQAFQHAKSQIISEAKYQVNKYFSTRDDYIGQRSMNNALTMANKAVSLGTSALAGFSMGMEFGGPAGALIGTLAAVTFGVADTAISVHQALDAQKLNIDAMNAQLSFMRQRSGYSLTSGSVGENK